MPESAQEIFTGADSKMRIAIVNDMKITVEVIRGIIEMNAPEHEIAWVAYDGAEAVEKCLKDTPDLILMDLLMPKLDGAEASRMIMDQSPCGILIVTATVSTNYNKVFEAMNNGALDAVDTPSMGEQQNIVPFLNKIQRLGLLCKPISRNEIKNSFARKNPPSLTPNLVVIGSSTGGPATICQTLSILPAGFNAAVVIIQQVDQAFAAGLASWIGENIKMAVEIAVDGETPENGKVYLAATNDHLTITETLKFKYTKEPESVFSRPSVDVFFESVAANWPGSGTAVILTGVGEDGARGMLALKNKGWNTIAQNQESCLVFGMPKAAIDNGAAQTVLPPSIIGRLLYESYLDN